MKNKVGAIFHNKRLGKVGGNFIYNTAYHILIYAIPLLTTPYLSRVLGATKLGEYSFAKSIADYFVLLILLGLKNYGNRSIARIRDNQSELKKTFWQIYFMQLFCGITLNVLYAFYCFFISSNKVMSFCVMFYVISGCFDINWFFFGIERFKMTVTRNTIIKIITTACVFIFVKDQNDVVLYAIIMTGGLLASELVLWPFLFQEIDFYRPEIKEILPHIKPNLMLFISVVAVSIYKIMDKIMLGIMANNTQVGFYKVSENIVLIPIAIIQSLGTVMLPHVTNMVANNDKNDLKLMDKSMQLCMFLSASMCFGIMGVCKEFIPIYYGKGYGPCVNVYLALLPSCLFLAFANVVRTQYLLPHRMDKEYILSAILGAVVNLIINGIFIPKMGAAGAAIGTLFAEMSVCVYQSYATSRFIPIKKYVKHSLAFIIPGFIMFCILFNLDWGLSNIKQLIIKIIIGIVIYFAVLSITWVIPNKIIKVRSCT